MAAPSGDGRRCRRLHASRSCNSTGNRPSPRVRCRSRSLYTIPSYRCRIQGLGGYNHGLLLLLHLLLCLLLYLLLLLLLLNTSSRLFCRTFDFFLHKR